MFRLLPWRTDMALANVLQLPCRADMAIDFTYSVRYSVRFYAINCTAKSREWFISAKRKGILESNSTSLKPPTLNISFPFFPNISNIVYELKSHNHSMLDDLEKAIRDGQIKAVGSLEIAKILNICWQQKQVFKNLVKHEYFSYSILLIIVAIVIYLFYGCCCPMRVCCRMRTRRRGNNDPESGDIPLQRIGKNMNI